MLDLNHKAGSVLEVIDYLGKHVAKAVCLFPSHDQLASKQAATPDDLIGESLIDIEPQLASHQMNVNAMRHMGTDPDIAVEYDANGHDAGFVAAGVGISVTNNIVAKEYSRFGLEFHPFEPGALYHYVVFWQKHRQLGSGLRYTLEGLVAAFAPTQKE